MSMPEAVKAKAAFMKKSEIRISIVPLISTTDWSIGKQLLETFAAVDERLLPERISNIEPVRTAFESIEACEPCWMATGTIFGPQGPRVFQHNFSWKRARAVKSNGYVIKPMRILSGELKLGWFTFSAAPDKKVDWEMLFKRLCRLLNPKFATLHLLTERESVSGVFGQEAINSMAANDFVMGSPDAALTSRGIPNLTWATYFGKHYEQEVNSSLIASQGYDVEQIGEGQLVKVTENLFDVANNFEYFSSQRAALKKLFRPGLFMIENEPIPVNKP